MTEPLFIAMPRTVPTRLKVAPRLASWNARDDREQQRLNSYLDHATALIRESLAAQTGGLAVRLDVSVAEGIDLLDQRDLDNYLFPLAFRLHQQGHPVRSWWATKSHQRPSLIRVGPAEAAPTPDAVINAETTASSESTRRRSTHSARCWERPIRIGHGIPGTAESSNWACTSTSIRHWATPCDSRSPRVRSTPPNSTGKTRMPTDRAALPPNGLFKSSLGRTDNRSSWQRATAPDNCWEPTTRTTPRPR